MPPIAIANWKRFFSTGDRSVLEACLAEEAIFESPVVHTPQVGKATTVKYLCSAQRVFYKSEFCVFARMGRFQLLCVGTADFDRWRFDKRGRYHFLE
jgi:hypothetical protein